MQKDGCKCEDQFKVIHDKVIERVKAVLDKLDEINKVNDSTTETILNFLKKIDGKLDKLIEKNNTATVVKQNCLTISEYKENLPVCCNDPNIPQHEVKKEKEVLPWEISEKCKDELLCEYETCIRKAIYLLDKWFKPGTWKRMPEKIKKIVIILFCKVGPNSMKFFNPVKVQLEAGNWKRAARILIKTSWATNGDQISAKDLYSRLYKVKEKMAKQ